MYIFIQTHIIGTNCIYVHIYKSNYDRDMDVKHASTLSDTVNRFYLHFHKFKSDRAMNRFQLIMNLGLPIRKLFKFRYRIMLELGILTFSFILFFHFEDYSEKIFFFFLI